MVQGGMTVVKYITFAFNFIFVLCGIALIVVGALVTNQTRGFEVFLGQGYNTSSIIVIIVGCIVLGLSFLGCCGAIKENYCMLMTFSVLLFLLLIVEIAAGITAFIYRKKVETIVNENMNNSMPKYNTTESIKKVWDTMQDDLKCCGLNGPEDWKAINLPYPQSCCDDRSTTCIDPTRHNGCFKKLEELVKKYILRVGIAAIIIAFIELLGMIFGCCLAHAIKKEYETV